MRPSVAIRGGKKLISAIGVRCGVVFAQFHQHPRVIQLKHHQAENAATRHGAAREQSANP